VFDGKLEPNDRIMMMANGIRTQPIEIGGFFAGFTPD